MRGRVLAVTLAAGLLLLGAAPAAPPEYPVSYIKVDELKAVLDRGGKADIIDVRHWDEYVELHIKGARSMPLRAFPQRAREISKTGLVVLY
jgi:rhodanese-related sulfurtransferase